MSPTIPRLPVAEPAREEAESAFTPILRQLADAIPSVVAVAFVDFEGECVDYHSSIDPYEAKVIAAQMSIVMDVVTRSMQKLEWGDAFWLEVLAAERVLVVRRVSDDHALVVTRRADGQDPRLLAAVDRAVEAFRVEAGAKVPRWEPAAPAVFVETRPAIGWAYAPVAFTKGGLLTQITDVLGRWIDRSGEICFRVYTDRGEEVTLVHYQHNDTWDMRG